MWQQYFRLDGLRASTSPLSTTIKLAALGRESMKVTDRTAEISAWWSRILGSADFDQRWEADVALSVRQTGVSSLLARSATEDQLNQARHERDSVQQDLESSRHTNYTTEAQLNQARHERDSVQHDLESSRRTNFTTEAQLNQARHERDSVQHDLEAIRNATSWRFTEPLRNLKDAWLHRRG
jgi:hypothetical protein